MTDPYRAPHAYMYIDSVGIDSLFSQTTERLETEVVEARERLKGGKAAGKFGLGGALKTLLGFDASAQGEVSLSQNDISEIKLKLTAEQKLAGLICYLQKSENEAYFERLPDGIQRINQMQSAVFLNMVACSLHVNTYLVPLIGNLRLQKTLTGRRVKRLCAELGVDGRVRSRGGLSEKTIHNIHATWSRALSDAVADRAAAPQPHEGRAPTARVAGAGDVDR